MLTLLTAIALTSSPQDEAIDLSIKPTHTLEEKVKILEARTEVLLDFINEHNRAFLEIKSFLESYATSHKEEVEVKPDAI